MFYPSFVRNGSDYTITTQEFSHTLSPSQIRSAARQTALQQIEVQKAEFKQLGIMADWDGSAGIYRTLGAL
jgi:isoleucyl-tRNA synthetase